MISVLLFAQMDNHGIKWVPASFLPVLLVNKEILMDNVRVKTEVRFQIVNIISAEMEL